MICFPHISHVKQPLKTNDFARSLRWSWKESESDPEYIYIYKYFGWPSRVIDVLGLYWRKALLGAMSPSYCGVHDINQYTQLTKVKCITIVARRRRQRSYLLPRDSLYTSHHSSITRQTGSPRTSPKRSPWCGACGHRCPVAWLYRFLYFNVYSNNLLMPDATWTRKHCADSREVFTRISHSRIRAIVLCATKVCFFFLGGHCGHRLLAVCQYVYIHLGSTTAENTFWTARGWKWNVMGFQISAFSDWPAVSRLSEFTCFQ